MLVKKKKEIVIESLPYGISLLASASTLFEMVKGGLSLSLEGSNNKSHYCDINPKDNQVEKMKRLGLFMSSVGKWQTRDL